MELPIEGATMTMQSPILEQIVEPDDGDFSPEHARYVLSLQFSGPMKARYARLAEQAQLGTLTEDDQQELDEYLSANTFLTILKSKARLPLKARGLTV